MEHLDRELDDHSIIGKSKTNYYHKYAALISYLATP